MFELGSVHKNLLRGRGSDEKMAKPKKIRNKKKVFKKRTFPQAGYLKV